ncbi:hypothetical protein SeLEV6574_g01356 [Synchytrium endobioticum]|nr:hypothetical protein SeLEV6574_g01356 [Synchytrium endobioticum]
MLDPATRNESAHDSCQGPAPTEDLRDAKDIRGPASLPNVQPVAKELEPSGNTNVHSNDRSFLPTRRPRNIKMELPDAIWERIFLFVAAEKDSLGSMQAIVLTNRSWRNIIQEPQFRAAYLLQKSCVHLAFYDAFKTRPSLLNMEVADAMLRMGCFLPKYFVEFVYRFHESTRNMSSAHPSLKSRLSDETVQLLVAHAYKTYGDTVDTTLGDKYSAETSDVALFDDCFGFATPDVTKIKELVDVHHFVPALASPTSADEWEVHWSNMIKLCRVNPSLGVFLAGHSGKDRPYVNDAMLSGALRNPKTTREYFSELLSLGYKLTPSSIEDILASTRYPIHDISYALEILRHFSPSEELIMIAERSLARLLKEATPIALRAADFIITELKVSEDGVMRALLVDTKSTQCRKAQPELVFATKLGKSTHRLKDGLWQLILGRYGADNVMTAACLQDLVVGGNGGGAQAPVKERSLNDSHSFNGPSNDTAYVHSANSVNDIDGEEDGPARDSIATLLESGVAIDPSMFGAVAQAVLVTKKCRPRFLDFLSRVEQTLAGCSLINLPPAPASMDENNKLNGDATKTRLARVRWTAALRRYVSDDPTWRQVAQVTPAHPPQGWRGYADQALRMLELPEYTRQMAEVRRFYREVEALFDELPEAANRIGTTTGTWEGPFTRWRNQLQWTTTHGLLPPSQNSSGSAAPSVEATSRRSSMGSGTISPPLSPGASGRKSDLIGSVRDSIGLIGFSAISEYVCEMPSVFNGSKP